MVYGHKQTYIQTYIINTTSANAVTLVWGSGPISTDSPREALCDVRYTVKFLLHHKQNNQLYSKCNLNKIIYTGQKKHWTSNLRGYLLVTKRNQRLRLEVTRSASVL